MRPPQRLVVIALGMVLWPLGDTRAHWPALAAESASAALAGRQWDVNASQGSGVAHESKGAPRWGALPRPGLSSRFG
jgi:hypothetical protein